MKTSPHGSRILALALPDLACELATLARESAVGIAGALSLDAPLAVVIAPRAEDMKPTSTLAAVTSRARRMGVFPGQTITAARARVEHIDIRRVSQDEISAALARVAEMALAFGPLVSVVMPETVLVDITGVAHLFTSGAADAEGTLLADLFERVRALGHHVRGAIAGGPATARAVARFGATPTTVVPPGQDLSALLPLPVRALAIEEPVLAWLFKVGVVTVSDLVKQPRETITPRLGSSAAEVLALLAGDDRAPLAPYTPPRILVEELSWEDGVRGTEPLLFVLRGLLGRLAARLEGRGEAASSLTIELRLDTSMAALAGACPETRIELEFPVPLAHAPELLRVARTRVEALSLAAPVVSVRVIAPQITRAPEVQLDLSRDVHASPDALAVLLAELTAELGDDAVGVFVPESSHLPEKRMALVPVDPASMLPRPPSRRRTTKRASAPIDDQMLLWPVDAPSPPTRILPRPVLLEGKLTRGGFVTVEHRPFTVKDLQRTERLDGIGWWTPSSTSRDYATTWLSTGTDGGGEAWVFRDRKTNRLYVHGWF